MKRVFVIIISCYFFTTGLYAQHENDVWVFGDLLGFDFSTFPPSVFVSGMQASAASASIADKDGNLLFYTNGRDVYNKNHSIMFNSNGLSGFSTSSQALIVPKPGSDNIHYIFSTSPNGFRFFYTEVDMLLDNGLGAVTSNKNRVLHSSTSERMTAVRHENNVDIWVISQSFTEFKAYLITCEGINTTPITSPLLKNLQSSSGNRQLSGYMKISPNGKKLGCTMEQDNASSTDTGRVELYDFDRKTGKVSNGGEFELLGPYGIEFSPNNRFMYVSNRFVDATDLFNPIANNNIYQYDISLEKTAMIDSSKVVVSESVNPSKGALQLGPDGLIYVAIELFDFTVSLTGAVGAIARPDLKGDDVNYSIVSRFVPVSPNIVRLGLPQVIPQPIVDTVSICENEVYTFNNKTYTEPGIYYDTVRSSVCDSIIYVFELKVKNLPVINPLLDDMYCKGVILPQIKGVNLTGKQAFYTKEKGGGIKYNIGDTLFQEIQLFAYDEVNPTCFGEKAYKIGECTNPFPNIFTPNGDDKNNTFKITFPNISQYDFIVYNRWGKVVYEQESYTNDWDAEGLPDGVYYYTFSHRIVKDVRKGQLTILR